MKKTRKPLFYLGAASVGLAMMVSPAAPANAGGGPCDNGTHPSTQDFPACDNCMQQIHNWSTCFNGTPPVQGGNPAQNICNITGACGQG
jgi:hypothetical protein